MTGRPLSANKRECPVGTPSLFVTPDHAHGRRGRPPLHPPADAVGGVSWLLLLHPVGAAPVLRAAAAKARAALPDRISQPEAATPSGRCSRDRSAARGKAGKMGISTKNGAAAQHPDTALCTVLPPQPAPPAQLPLLDSDSPAVGTGCPGTPPTHDRRRSSGPGVSARSSPAARPPCRPGTHSLSGSPLPSLHDPRHRSCTGSRLLAALPALDALRHCSGKRTAAGSCQGRRGPRR